MMQHKQLFRIHCLVTPDQSFGARPFKETHDVHADTAEDAGSNARTHFFKKYMATRVIVGKIKKVGNPDFNRRAR